MVFFKSEIVEVSLRIGDHDQIGFVAFVAHLQRCLLIEFWELRPQTGDRELESAVVGGDFFSLSGKPLQPLAIRLDHADKQRYAHNTEHKSDIA